MLGVLKRRWKPKRASSNNNNRQQPPPDPLDTPASIITANNTSNGTIPPHLIPCHPPPTINTTITEKSPRIVAPSARQVHPVYEDKAQLLSYDKPPPPTALFSDSNHPVVNNKRASSSLDQNQQLGFGKHSGVSSPEHSPPPYQKRASVDVDLTYNGFSATPITANGTAASPPTTNTASPVSPYPIVPNICVAAGGRIEFIKPPPLPTATPQILPIKSNVPLPPPRLDVAAAPAVVCSVSACSSDVIDTSKCAILPPPTARCCAPPSPALAAPHPLVTEARITVTRGLQTEDERMMEEKYDDDKEQLVEKIAELEDELEAAKKAEIKEKANLHKLQRQLSRRETAHRDAERERRLRVDSESRTKQALQEAARCRSRLKLLTNEFSRMEESVRSMLVYKKQAEQLRQEKAALTIAFENRCQQYQATVVRLNQEVQQLRSQLDKPFIASLQKADGGGNPNNGSNQDYTQCSMLQRHVEEARKQYEKCLDDVANQVVRALVAQKGLKEEVATLNARIQELETQNSALTSMLVHQIRNSDASKLSQRESVCLNSLLDPVEIKESDATSNITSNDVSPALNNIAMTSSLTFKHCNSFNSEILEKSPNNDASTTLGEEVERTISRIEKHLSADSDILETRFSIEDKKRHQVLTRLWTDLKKAEVTPRRLIEALSAVDAALLLPPKRPMSLNLQIPVLHQGVAVPQNIATIGTARCKRTRPVLCHHAVRPSNAITSNDIANVSVSTTSSSSGKLISGVNSHHPNISSTSTASGTTTVPNSSSILLQNGSSIGSANDESPESNSGNRDEGYSTMSSDVQTTTSSATDVVTVRCSSSSTGGGSTGSRETLIAMNGRGGCLEDLQEAIDESCATAAAAAASDYLHHLVVTGAAAGVVDCCEPGETDVLYIPLGLIGNLKTRNSFPPGKDLLPFQHIMRSFSDSHLCIKITTAPSPCYSFSSPISSSPSILLLDITEKGGNPLRRAKATTSLLANTNLIFNEESSPGSEDYIDCPKLDAEYIQHWLRLDETRSAMQQQQQLLELEYDTTELEDWSLSLSSEDLAKEQWRRNTETTITPGQISLSTLPSIQENNALELEEDSNECLWNNSSYMVDKEGSEIVTLLMDTNNSTEQQWPYAVNYHLNLNNSPDNSWSSNGSDCCPSNEPETFSKRSSAALSGCSDDTGELPAVGTDFTRDFYRLVKFESTKSLASTSSRSVAGSAAISENGIGDRETALQNVLTFIAEQQKYVQAREDSVTRSCSLADLTKEFNIEAPPQQLKDIKICECDRERIYNDTDENYVTLKQLCAEYTLNEQNTLANEAITSSSKPLITPQPLTNISTSVIAPKSINIAYADEVCLVQALEDASLTENCSPIGDLPVDICSSISIELASTEYQNGVFSMEPMEGEADDESEKLENELIQSTASTDSNNQSESLTSSVSTPDTVISKIPRRKPSISRIPISPAKVNSSPTLTIQSQSSANSSPITNSPIHQTHSAESSPKLSKIPQKKSRISRPKSHSNNSSPTHKPKLPKKDTLPKFTKSSNINGPAVQHLITSEHLPQSSYRYSSASIVSTIIEGPPHRAVSFHERATSKDVIDELNRMIRNGGEDGGSSQECLDVVEGQANGTIEKLDEAACKATGWIHVERDVDLSDPKMRASLLDVMMASVSSDSSPTSSCGGSVTSESVEEPPDYGQLHRIHKFHRQKKVNAIRPTDNGILAVVRVAGSSSVRPSIIGRPDFYLRYGEKEREAVASFDFLDELSGGSSSGGGSPSAGGNGCQSPQSLSFDADGLIDEDDRSRGVCPI